MFIIFPEWYPIWDLSIYNNVYTLCTLYTHNIFICFSIFRHLVQFPATLQTVYKFTNCKQCCNKHSNANSKFISFPWDTYGYKHIWERKRERRERSPEVRSLGHMEIVLLILLMKFHDFFQDRYTNLHLANGIQGFSFLTILTKCFLLYFSDSRVLKI